MDYDTLIKALRKTLVVASVDDPILPVTSLQEKEILRCFQGEVDVIVTGIRFPIGKIDIVLAKAARRDGLGRYHGEQYRIIVMGDNMALYSEKVHPSDYDLVQLLFEKREKIIDALLKDFLES